MRDLSLTGIAVAVVAVLGLSLAFFSLPASFGAVSSIDSNSMSHGPEEREGVLDPGEWRRLVPVDARQDVATLYEARQAGRTVGGDHGDVIAYHPNGTDPGSSGPSLFPGTGGDDGLTIEHRAIAWVTYNESADAYDVLALGIEANRSFTLPDVGSYDADAEAYVHEDLSVQLDPDRAGRHDGFLTKGDNSPTVDQDARARLGSAGSVELVPPARIEGKVAGHVDGSTIVAFQIGVPVAALLAAGGVYAVRRGHLDRVLPAAEEDRPCPACGRTVGDEAAFCPSCGELVDEP